MSSADKPSTDIGAYINQFEIIHSLDIAVKAFKARRAELHAKASSIDAQINEYYHVIEAINLNAVEMMKITKLLKMSLRERRAVKEEAITFNNIMANSLGDKIDHLSANLDKEIKNSESRVKKYQTESQASYTKIFGKSKKV